ncbi:MAG: SDR family NAD(P)-dependent oxidoreductase [Candidatus Binatia bacterium]
MGVLEGKAALVTGAGRGIGRGHCVHLAAAGAAVVVNDIDVEQAERVVAEIAAAGGKAIAEASNVATREGAEALVGACAEAFGGVDIVVNNAGIARDRSFLKMSDEEFEDVWRVHVMGTFLCAQVGARRMREQGRGGSIINTTSAAHMGNFGQANYAAAKGAIASMTYTLAIELARYGIRVNAVSPAATTRLSQTFKGPDGKEIEMPFLDPALNGPMVVFLCSAEGSYVTGQVFGTGADRVVLLTQPQYGSAMIKPGGWRYEDLVQHFKLNLGSKLEPLGIQKKPYPFYGGIEPPEK